MAWTLSPSAWPVQQRTGPGNR